MFFYSKIIIQVLERVNGNDALEYLSLEEGTSNDDSDSEELPNPVTKQSDKYDEKEEKDEDLYDLMQTSSLKDEEKLSDETRFRNIPGNLSNF